MTITLNIPDDSATNLLNGVCSATGWTSASGVAQADWAKTKLSEWLKATAKRGLLKTQVDSIAASVDTVAIS